MSPATAGTRDVIVCETLTATTVAQNSAQFSPSKSGKAMPPSLQGIMSVFHDELSKRGTNCMPSDFEDRSHEPELW